MSVDQTKTPATLTREGGERGGGSVAWSGGSLETQRVGEVTSLIITPKGLAASTNKGDVCVCTPLVAASLSDRDGDTTHTEPEECTCVMHPRS